MDRDRIVVIDVARGATLVTAMARKSVATHILGYELTSDTRETKETNDWLGITRASRVNPHPNVARDLQTAPASQRGAHLLQRH